MTRRLPRAVVGSSPEVEAAAEEMLKKGNAVDAVVAGMFAACALSPSALLGPAQILLGGAGAGLYAVDGRVRQPGNGAPRPRGFLPEEDIPEGARVGVPFLPAALAAALATAGSIAFATILGPAIALAKGSGRDEVLGKFAARGPRAIEERPLSSELLAVAGRPEGGLLTADDLAAARPDVLPATRLTSSSGRFVAYLPWAHVEDGAVVAPVGGPGPGAVRAILAVDRHGTFAVGAWEEAPDGVNIPELGLRAPPCAEPVRRGQTRVRPGDARPSAAPIALVGTPAGPDVAFAAHGARDAYDVLREAIAGLVADDRIEAHGEARLFAVSQAQGVASVFRS